MRATKKPKPPKKRAMNDKKPCRSRSRRAPKIFRRAVAVICIAAAVSSFSGCANTSERPDVTDTPSDTESTAAPHDFESGPDRSEMTKALTFICGDVYPDNSVSPKELSAANAFRCIRGGESGWGFGVYRQNAETEKIGEFILSDSGTLYVRDSGYGAYRPAAGEEFKGYVLRFKNAVSAESLGGQYLASVEGGQMYYSDSYRREGGLTFSVSRIGPVGEGKSVLSVVSDWTGVPSAEFVQVYSGPIETYEGVCSARRADSDFDVLVIDFYQKSKSSAKKYRAALVSLPDSLLWFQCGIAEEDFARYGDTFKELTDGLCVVGQYGEPVFGELCTEYNSEVIGIQQ